MYSSSKEISKSLPRWLSITPVKIFIVSAMVVNGGNYFYNLFLGKNLSPNSFAETGFVITILLIFSFLGMTFQLVSTKFAVEFESQHLEIFKSWITKVGLITAMVILLVLLLFNATISSFFNLTDLFTLPILTVSLPLYFLMSINRGLLQGQEKFIPLSISYQLEVWGKFILTVVLFNTIGWHFANLVAISIVVSIFLGLAAASSINNPIKWPFLKLEPQLKYQVIRFFLITAGYEVTQAIVNYADLIIVKHYFENYIAGLYTSVSLIGKMVYFVTWMIVMVFVPKVLKFKKEGKAYRKLMINYLTGLIFFTCITTLISFLFPEFIVKNLFSSEYLEVTRYLWKYALSTSFFALSNVFVYYFLTMEDYKPVFIAMGTGIVQVLSFTWMHDSIDQMIEVQIFYMSIMFLVQLVFFLRKG